MKVQVVLAFRRDSLRLLQQRLLLLIFDRLCEISDSCLHVFIANLAESEPQVLARRAAVVQEGLPGYKHQTAFKCTVDLEEQYRI